MKAISIDIETFSSVDLAKAGAYRYCESPDFEILLFGYSVDGGPVQVVDLASGEAIPQEILDAMTDEAVTKWAFNASFERVCLSRYLLDQGISVDPFHDRHPLSSDCACFLNPESWRCSMIWSAYMGMPLSLAEVGAVLGLEKQKLTEGKELIKYFCRPCEPTQSNGGRKRNRPADAPDKWETFKSYNLRDVEVEMEIQRKLSSYPVPDDVWDQYHIDQEINDRGIKVDMTLVENAIAMDARSRAELTDMMQKLTHLENPNSVQQMKQWLINNGLEIDSLGKKQVIELLKDAPPQLRDVLLLRQQLAKSSVKKYLAMKNAVCADNRVRGMFQFYGANRSGRWAGRNVQLQNLPQNHMPDLGAARGLVREGNYDAIHMLYGSVPDVLSELIRTAFIPVEGQKLIVSDFSAIEARVIAWLAGEQWRLDLFARGGDIYCQSASEMFKVPVEKHGVNGHLRQKGKIAELACIAEGQLVLTNHGEKPIETVTMEDLIWDGESWVRHEGVIFKGIQEVITYDGLTATSDHLVWVEGESEPVQFGFAAASGAHLLQTGDRGKAIRLGENHQPGEALEQQMESLFRADAVRGMRSNPVAGSEQSDQRHLKGMPVMLTSPANSVVAGSETDSRETALRESERTGVSELRRQRNSISVRERSGGGALPHSGIRDAGQNDGIGSDKHERSLRAGESSLYNQIAESGKSQEHCAERVRSAVLAICEERGYPETVSGADQGRDYTGRGDSSVRETEKLAAHQRTARLYDIRNAGPNHRFTVSGRLVHNCGYGGSVGAPKAMGALDMGLQEEELAPLVQAWRTSNPSIVKLWWDVDDAVMTAIREKTTTRTHGLTFAVRSGMLFITLPSGRQLSYVKPRIGENQFGSPAATYMGVGGMKKWERIESYGPKFVENIVQGISRDILCYAMKTLRCCRIVAHVHDELIIEADPRMSLDAVCEQMGRTPPWAEGLLLRADGYECEFYRKD
ncbi:MAG: hypothetical protein IKH57_20095 [Clostridia bacterium]|nr:hypothetical protein [Clostridia bacterium]